MTTPESRAELDMILDSIDSPRALVILVDEQGEIETASKRLTPEDMMIVAFSLARELYEQLVPQHPEWAQSPRINGRPALYLPPGLDGRLRGLN